MRSGTWYIEYWDEKGVFKNKHIHVEDSTTAIALPTRWIIQIRFDADEEATP